jgi:hypothetical protein
MKQNNFFWIVFITFSVYSVGVSAQTNIAGQATETEGNDRLNTITTAVPFLIIAPDSRAGGMGESGVASSPDVNSNHWNPSKLAFVEDEFGAAVSYSPWLRGLVDDIFLAYVSGYKKIDDMQSIGASLRYFSLGNITFTNEYGDFIQDYEPQELAFDLTYARKLANNFSGGIALRYINSNLTGGQVSQGASTKPGRAVAVDVSGYYFNDDLSVMDKDAEFAFGINVSNIGSKMAYSASANRDFIPVNLRLGPRFTLELDEFNKISFTLDVNKLLVPTPPMYNEDGSGDIVAGKDPNRAVASGVFGSFNDAPGKPLFDSSGDPLLNSDGTYQVKKGSVFQEELTEINYAVGLEYWYGKQFALRGGYFWEHALKGNRKFVTLGAGLKYNVFALDFAYLIPTYLKANVTQSNPLKNTLRFTLSFNFQAFKDQQDASK